MIFIVVLKVLAIVILVFWLIGMIKVGISLSFINDRLSLGVIVLGKRISLDGKIKKKSESKQVEKTKKPIKEKDDKPKKEKKAKPVSLSLTFDDIIKIIKKSFKSISRLNKGFNFDRFLLHVIVATDNPYNTAILFGDLNALLCALEPICSKRFTCKDLDIWTDVTFNEVIPRVDIAFDLTIRIHSFFRRIDIIFYALWVYICAKTRGIALKFTDKDEYEYQIELKKARNEKFKLIMNNVKSKNNEKNKTVNNSGMDERTSS